MNRYLPWGLGFMVVATIFTLVFLNMPMFDKQDTLRDINNFRLSHGVHRLYPNKALDRVAKIILMKYVEGDRTRYLKVEDVALIVGYQPNRINKIIIDNVSDSKGALRVISLHPKHAKALLRRSFNDVGISYSQRDKVIVIVMGSESI